MADKTEITWTDSTFNPWLGCTKVAPGCDHCYAEEFDKRFGGKNWGIGSVPRIMSDNNWRNPVRWQKKAELTGDRRKVFCGSMCDWCDKNAPKGQRDRLWQLIRDTPDLDWQLLTKRAPNIKKYLPVDWLGGYQNVWLGVTVENKKHGLRRLDMLRDIPAKVRFLSIEPLIENLGDLDLSGIHWVIVGGESGNQARPMDPAWVDSIQKQGKEQEVPFFFKQWGGRRNKGGCLLRGHEVKEWPWPMGVSYE